MSPSEPSAPRIMVTFKHEDEERGMAVGPVCVIDLDVYERDPEVSKGGLGIPFGYKPEGMAELGWRTKREALKLAASLGVELEES